MRAPATAIAAELSWPQVLAFRLQRHHLTRRAPKKDMVRVAGDIGGLQAQVMSAAELQLAVRADCATRDVGAALWKKKSLVKTWLMRGTLHLIPADDLPLFTAAMSGPWVRPRASWLKYFELSQSELDLLIDTIGGTLNGQPLSREEIIAVAGKGQSDRVREWLKSGWGGVLKPVARSGRLCFGPSRGQAVTFVNPKEWLGTWREIEPEAAAAEVARRYLSAYGPASKNDFTSWFGSWPGVGNIAWSRLSDELVDVSVGGARFQMLAADLKHLPARTYGVVNLLPAFDPYLMGHSSRHHLFDASHRSKVTRTAGWISQVVLVDGRVEAVWTHQVASGALRVKVQPFDGLDARTRAEVESRANELAEAMALDEVQVDFS